MKQLTEAEYVELVRARTVLREIGYGYDGKEWRCQRPAQPYAEKWHEAAVQLLQSQGHLWTGEKWVLGAHVSAPSALAKQEGGEHYKQMPLQPWEIIERNKLDFWQGNVIKYTMRYKSKGGAEDLRKAAHYLEYLIEREQTATR